MFTGDTLFKNSVGGVRAPGHTTYDDLRSSIMDRLMALPPETAIRPGSLAAGQVVDGVAPEPCARCERVLREDHRFHAPERSCVSASVTTVVTISRRACGTSGLDP